MKRLLFAVVICGPSACGDDLPTDASGTSSASTAATDTGADASTAAAPDTGDTADTTAGPEPQVVLDVDLALETTRAVSIVITQTGDELRARVTPSEGFGVAAAGDPIEGPARIDEFPEAGATFYSARLSGLAVADGPCGDEPVSLALALHLDADASFLAGGLTPYCGADTWFGVPVVEPLRISGTP